MFMTTFSFCITLIVVVYLSSSHCSTLSTVWTPPSPPPFLPHPCRLDSSRYDECSLVQTRYTTSIKMFVVARSGLRMSSRWTATNRHGKGEPTALSFPLHHLYLYPSTEPSWYTTFFLHILPYSPHFSFSVLSTTPIYEHLFPLSNPTIHPFPPLPPPPPPPPLPFITDHTRHANGSRHSHCIPLQTHERCSHRRMGRHLHPPRNLSARS